MPSIPATHQTHPSSRPDSRTDVRPAWWLPVTAGAAATVLVALVWLAARVTEGDVGRLVRDPSTTFGASQLTGAAAMLNATLWGVAAALGAFVASLHRAHRPGLLLFTGLSLFLLVEDTVQVKGFGERVGVPEALFLLAYGVAALLAVWLLRPSRTGAAGWTLVAAGALLAASIVVDQVRGATSPGTVLLEFAPMLVGTAVWACVPVLLHHHLSRPGSRSSGGADEPVER